MGLCIYLFFFEIKGIFIYFLVYKFVYFLELMFNEFKVEIFCVIYEDDYCNIGVRFWSLVWNLLKVIIES